MESNSNLRISYEASQDDRDFLLKGIRDYNSEIGPMLSYPPYDSFPVVMKDNDGIIGGILTRIYLQCMFVELLWVDDEKRKSGIGSALLNEAEKIAKENKCRFIHLDTFSFQAINFYKKYGYTVFAVLDDYPGDIKRYFLKKIL